MPAKGQEMRYWQKLWVLSHFPSEKASVEKFARKADAKLVVQCVQSTVLIAVIKPGNKITDGKGGKEPISWYEL